MSGQTTMLSTYVEPDRCPLTWDRPTVVSAFRREVGVTPADYFSLRRS